MTVTPAEAYMAYAEILTGHLQLSQDMVMVYNSQPAPAVVPPLTEAPAVILQQDIGAINSGASPQELFSLPGNQEGMSISTIPNVAPPDPLGGMYTVDDGGDIVNPYDGSYIFPDGSSF